MESPATVPPKKVYQAPKLRVYGDLSEMTKTSGMSGQKDGGTAGFKRHTGA